MAQPKTWQEMLEWSAGLLERRTGAGVEEWNRRIAERGVARDEDTEKDLRGWLRERGVTGYSQMLLVMERFGYPDFLTADADDLLDGQYADRAHLRPILDRVLAVAPSLGEVVVQARKTYVALQTRRRQFAVVRPTTRKRVDLGVRLDGVEPAGRLEAAKGVGNDTINLRVGLHDLDDVDDEVVEVLRRAYAANE
ncbi:MAG: DUF5655 domain-containing protein [Nocardioidaceae bacterium]